MAEVQLHPAPQSFPPGTAVLVKPYPKVGGQLHGEPPGTTVGTFTVSSAGVLAVTPVTEGESYVGWANVGGSDRYVAFRVDVVATGGGEGTGEATRTAYHATGLTGAGESSRYVGATATGAPTAGTWEVGDFAIDRSGAGWVCTVAGTPGTWKPLGGSGAVSSVNAKTGAVVLGVADIAGAAPLASPALTGTPTAPTAAEATNSTQLATTAFAHTLVGTEQSRAEGQEALRAPLASPALTGTPTAPTAAEATNNTQLATTAFAHTLANAAQAGAEAASAVRLKVAAEVTAGATLAANSLTPANATAGAFTLKLPTGQAQGTRVAVEKVDAGANEVTIEGSIRGVAAQTETLKLAHQVKGFVADAAGSWWPLFTFLTVAALDARYEKKVRFGQTFAILGTVTTAAVPGFYVSLPPGAKSLKLVKARYHITEGTEVTGKLQVNGSDATGFTGIVATTTPAEKTGEVTLAENDLVTFVPATAVGTPKNLNVSCFLELTV